jgi:hypothetical protein
MPHSLLCTFLAKLAELWFPAQFGSDAERRAWLEEKLWLQRDGWKAKGPDRQSQSWQETFQAREIEPFMEAQTYYIIRNLRAIEPLSLSRLVKLINGQALADNYTRGYAICHFPEPEGTLSVSNTFNMANPGDTKSFRAYVITPTGNEKGSNTVTIIRPEPPTPP